MDTQQENDVNTNPDSRGGFTLVPNSLSWCGKELSLKEKVFCCDLLSHDFQKGWCNPGRIRIAQEMGVSVSTVDRLVASTVRKGLVIKKRMGLGKTNVYYLDGIKNFEANKSPVSDLDQSGLVGKEEFSNNNKINNYPANRRSLDTAYKEKTPNSGSQSESKTEIVFRKLLSKVEESLLEDLSESMKDLEDKFRIVRVVVLYYLKLYENTLGIKHPYYKVDHLYECYFNCLCQISFNYDYYYRHDQEVLQGYAIDAIDRWFQTTKHDENNLRLAHFLGGKSNKTFENCLNYVMYETH